MLSGFYHVAIRDEDQILITNKTLPTKNTHTVLSIHYILLANITSSLVHNILQWWDCTTNYRAQMYQI